MDFYIYQKFLEPAAPVFKNWHFLGVATNLNFQTHLEGLDCPIIQTLSVLFLGLGIVSGIFGAGGVLFLFDLRQALDV